MCEASKTVTKQINSHQLKYGIMLLICNNFIGIFKYDTLWGSFVKAGAKKWVQVIELTFFELDCLLLSMLCCI